MLCSVSPSDRLSVVFAATISAEEVTETSNSVELLISVSHLTDSIMSRQKDQSSVLQPCRALFIWTHCNTNTTDCVLYASVDICMSGRDMPVVL